MRYLIVSPLIVPAGSKLELSSDQAALRQHAVRPCGDGTFEALQALQFKVGEEIGYDGEVPKALAHLVEADTPERPAKGTVQTRARRAPKNTHQRAEAAPTVAASATVGEAGGGSLI